MEEYITTTKAAEALGVTRRHIVRLIKSGKVEARKVNNRLWLVNRASLTNWTRKRKRREKPIE